MLSRVFVTLLAVMATMTGLVQARPAKSVFAHFMVGNAANMSPAQWDDNIAQAMLAGIDGFALNCGPQDSYTQSVLDMAYASADQHGFKLFISFDYLSAGPWPVDRVVTLVNRYAGRPSQFLGDTGRPFVSTFEGPGNAGDWAGIKSQTGAYFVPDWSSVGPGGFGAISANTDGVFNWNAWPVAAAGTADASSDPNIDDAAWKAAVGSGVYMMGVSPWFYTNLPQWGKNWMWDTDELWVSRWNQILARQPDLVEIITWNDYGESHYVGPILQSGIPGSASRYVDNMPHTNWLDILPAFIKAYKAGKSAVDPADIATEQVSFWYRPNPIASGSLDGTMGNAPYQAQVNPAAIVKDNLYVAALAKQDATIEVTIGGVRQTQNASPGLTSAAFPFGAGGDVKVRLLQGKNADSSAPVIASGSGTSIGAPANGAVNLNAFVGGTNTRGPGAFSATRRRR